MFSSELSTGFDEGDRLVGCYNPKWHKLSHHNILWFNIVVGTKCSGLGDKEIPLECPKCHKSEIIVIDSRDVDENTIRRRRECSKCNYRFTTYEKVEPVRFTVQKKDGSVEPYDRTKMIKGMSLATEKRNIGSEKLDEVADRIEHKLVRTGKSVIPSRRIGDAVICELKELDDVAYLRFASVYKEFRSGKSFEKEIKKLNKE